MGYVPVRVGRLAHQRRTVHKDPKLKEQYRVEARFVRALMYFWLVRDYGDVPRVEKQVSVGEAYTLGRAPGQEIYDFIIADLKFAENNLPATYATVDKGRATLGGAKGLLAKVYMTMAGYPLKKAHPITRWPGLKPWRSSMMHNIH